MILADYKNAHLKIDVMVYRLYELNYAEAKVIDKNLSIEDFEKYKL